MIRPQYHFRRSETGLQAWNVARLIQAAADLPVIPVPLSSIAEIDEVYWGGAGDKLTVREIAGHAALIRNADVSIPILLCAGGRVMDGMHRVARALMDGAETIPARRFAKTPDPDVNPAEPDRLSYDPCEFTI